MERAIVYIHGMGGNAGEAGHYRALFPEHDVLGFAYRAETPWEAREEFTEYFAGLGGKYPSVLLIANSIGAYFAMNAGAGEAIERAFFISPVVDMEGLIRDRMQQAGVTEEELRRKKEIGTLSWDYLRYVRENPIRWTVPTHIFYGERDELTPPETVRQFAGRIGASLDVMPGGEHWFHTPEQMDWLDRHIRRASDLGSPTARSDYKNLF